MSLVESVSQLLSSTLSPVKVGQARDHYLLTLSDNDSAPISVPCSNVWLHGPEDRCAFVSGNVECQDELSYIDYVSFVFCAFGDGGKAGAIMIAVSIISFTTSLEYVSTTDCFLVYLGSHPVRGHRNNSN